MDATIALPSHSLANLVHAAYADGGDIDNLLAPYHITADQVEELAQQLWWPGRPHVSHPLFAVVKEARQISTPAANKERFIFLATALSHVWLVRQPTQWGGGLRRICTYEGVGAPVPHAWLHVNRQGMLTLCAASPGMPALAVTVNRSCTLGFMRSLELDLNVDAGTRYGCSYLELYVNIEGGGGGGGGGVEVVVGNCESTTANYALLFTSHGQVCCLDRALLVSPSLCRSWTLPVVVHEMRDE